MNKEDDLKQKAIIPSKKKDKNLIADLTKHKHIRQLRKISLKGMNKYTNAFCSFRICNYT